ncbi:MAG: hypothetical protein JJD92_15440 [Frankiaceae bacterium]|nr:hypothetical protein [Frankiaceae bacterium]
MWPKLGVAVAAALLVSAVGVTTVGGASAAPTTQCRSVKGTITITGTGAFTGKATGSLPGTLSNIVPADDFTGSNIRTTWSFTITDRAGVAADYVMDVLGTNFTGTTLVGGGILSELSLPVGTSSAIHVTLGPQDDSPEGAQPDVYSYAGQRCIETVP